MHKLVLIESVASDADRFKDLLPGDEFEILWCQSGIIAESEITSKRESEFAAAVVRWELSEPQLGFRLLLHLRKTWSNVPVIVISATLDAAMVTRAYALGARDFLEMPVTSEAVHSCLRSLLDKQTTHSPLVDELRKTILGNSPRLLETFRDVAKVIPLTDRNVLITGEAGTGKELFAQAIHALGNNKTGPWVAVNVGAVPATLIESLLFGYERGAFTGASERHPGFLEQANSGTLFLDEIGDLDLSLQVKLLRVLQEKQFWRLGGKVPQDFKARVILATNHDLAQDVNNGSFRRDLYDRITEVEIKLPALRERPEDITLLAQHFVELYAAGRELTWLPATLSILNSYSFPGNVRELQNLVKGAVLECDEEVIRPRHLPLMRMGAFIHPPETTADVDDQEQVASNELLKELNELMRPNWLDLSYRDAMQPYEKAFNRVYLSQLLRRNHHNVTRAAAVAGIDTKTFRKRWRNCGLPPLTAAGDASDD